MGLTTQFNIDVDCNKIKVPFLPIFLQRIKEVINKSKAYSSMIIGMMFYKKKYYIELEYCDSIFSLLRRALEYINKTEVLF